MSNSLESVRQATLNGVLPQNIGESHIVVTRHNDLITSDMYEVITPLKTSGRGEYYEVQIMWENNLSDYHDLGLFGSYRTDYVDMSYSGGILTINSDNGIKIEITNS